MSLLAVDIGNTSTTIGFFGESGKVEHRFDIPTRTLTHRALTRETLDGPLTGLGAPAIIGIASVVPWASDELIVVLHEIYPNATIHVITSTSLPIEIRYPNPDELGSDRLIGALAAYKLFGQAQNRPCISVDLGTATTYDCITKEGVFLGGAIAPGLELGAEALAQRAAQLPPIELAFPTSVIGQTTTQSMQSGILYGGVAALEGMIDRLKKEAFPGEQPIVVATGGLSKLVHGYTNVIDRLEPELVLEGIRIATEFASESAVQIAEAEIQQTQ